MKKSTFRTIEVAGIDAALRALRLPHNGEPYSRLHSNFLVTQKENRTVDYSCHTNGYVDERDIQLMQKLQIAGDHHAKVLRGIIAWVEIEAPIYFKWDLDTYAVGHTRLCSGSTMHTECKGLYGEKLQEVKGEIPFGRMIKSVDCYSYQALRRIVYQRHNHRLPEFGQMIEWIHTLPFAEELIFYRLSKENGDPQLPKLNK